MCEVCYCCCDLKICVLLVKKIKILVGIGEVVKFVCGVMFVYFEFYFVWFVFFVEGDLEWIVLFLLVEVFDFLIDFVFVVIVFLGGWYV